MNRNTLISSQTPAVVASEASSGALQEKLKRGTGLMPLCVGTAMTVTGSDGRMRGFTSLSRAMVLAEAAKEGRTVKAVCHCLLCNKDFASEEELRAAHADTIGMRARVEQHTWFWYSEDPLDADPAKVADLDKRIAGAKALRAKLHDRLAKAEDVEEYTATTNRIAAVDRHMEDLDKERVAVQEAIVGVFTDGPTISERTEQTGTIFSPKPAA